MGLFAIFIVLLCAATSFFCVGAVTGVKLGSNYNSAVSLKTAIVFTVVALLAMALSFILGRMLYPVLTDVLDWVGFALLLLIAIHFSITQSCPTLCDPMDCSMPDFPAHHYLPVCSNSCALSW